MSTKKRVTVLNVSHHIEGNEWTIIFSLSAFTTIVVPVIEPDARAFISTLRMREEKIYSRGTNKDLPPLQTGSMFY